MYCTIIANMVPSCLAIVKGSSGIANICPVPARWYRGDSSYYSLAGDDNATNSCYHAVRYTQKAYRVCTKDEVGYEQTCEGFV
jgi:hypothetical protein